MGNRIYNWYNLEYKNGQYLKNYFQGEKFDLVVLNNSVFVSLLFVRVCKKLSIPIVTYERGIAYFEKQHIRATGDIQASIPISDAVHEFLLKHNYRARIIERIYDGIEPSSVWTHRSPAEIKAALGIPEVSRVVGIIGNIRPWKGHRYFVEAFLQLSRKYDDLYGLIIGGWARQDEEFQAELLRTTREAGLSDRLLFLGYRTDTPELLSILDVMVHASIKPEPFGMVLLESMAAKRPIVATNFGGPLEILNKGECGILVPPKDSKAIGNACSRYLEDRPFSQKMTDIAYKRLVSNFHISQTVKKTTELYSRVIELHRDG